MKRLTLSLLVTLMYLVPMDARAQNPNEWCATPSLSPEERWEARTDMQRRLAGKRFAIDGPVVIPMAFHIILDSNGEGDITMDQIEAQVEHMTVSYSDHDIEFVLGSVDYTVNDLWYYLSGDYEVEMKSSLAIDPAHNMNVYSANLQNNLLGWAQFPWWYDENSYMHGFVMHYGSFPGGYIENYDEGDVAVHEGGHCFGLYHTFQGGCSDGDEVEDTPAQHDDNNIFDCDPSLDTCPSDPGMDPIYNFMNYTNDYCTIEFSDGQGVRMVDMIAVYKPGYLSAYQIPDELDPAAPSDFTAYSDYLTPTSVSLTWGDPDTLVNGETITDFSIIVERDGDEMAVVIQGVESYSDDGLTDGQTYSYSIYAELAENDSASLFVSASVICGGSPEPSSPEDFLVEASDTAVTLSWTNPAVQVDGTPLDDLSAVRIYRNGEFLTDVETSDAGAEMNWADDVDFGFSYDYNISAVDNESAENESDISELQRVWFGDVPDILIWNPENISPSSATALSRSIFNLGWSAAEVQELITFGGGLYDTGFKAIFVLCGVFPRKYEIWDGQWGHQGDLFKLRYYLNDGGSIYMEAGDEFGNLNAGTLTDKFLIEVSDEGANNLSTIEGIFGTPTEGVSFDYDGGNFGIDHLEPLEDAVPIFYNTSPSYYNGIAYDGGDYKTIGTSFEFGGLVDDESNNKTELLASLLNFLTDTSALVLEEQEVLPLTYALHQNYPNPFNPNTAIRFDLPRADKVELIIYDILGREVATLVSGKLVSGIHEFVWNASNVSSGIYLYRLTSEQGVRAKKLVLIK